MVSPFSAPCSRSGPPVSGHIECASTVPNTLAGSVPAKYSKLESKMSSSFSKTLNPAATTSETAIAGDQAKDVRRVESFPQGTLGSLEFLDGCRGHRHAVERGRQVDVFDAPNHNVNVRLGVGRSRASQEHLIVADIVVPHAKATVGDEGHRVILYSKGLGTWTPAFIHLIRGHQS